MSNELKAFLQYVAGEAPSSEITKRLDDLVHKAREHKEWRLEYMTLLERDEQMREEGRKEGLQKGLEEGLQKGRKAGIDEGRKEERTNTLREKERADKAESDVKSLKEELAALRKLLASQTAGKTQ